MADSELFRPKGPGRILEETTLPSASATETLRPEPQLGARRRKPYQGDLDAGTQVGSSAHETPPSGPENQLPKIHVDGKDGIENIDSALTANDAASAERIIEMSLADGTAINYRDRGVRRHAHGFEVVPEILRQLSRRPPDELGAKHPSSFADHYISLAPLPQFQDFNTATYILKKDHHNQKSTLKVPVLYNGYDIVNNPIARVTFFKIAEKCQFLDRCMAELFKALLRNLSKDFVECLLSRAKATIVKSDPSQSSTEGPASPERQSSRETFLGELGHHLECICKGENPDFMVHRVGEERLDYLQDALELPYWDLIVDLFQATSSTKRASGISETIMDNAVAGCYQFIKNQLQCIKDIYINGEINEVVPERILEGITLRLHVLEKYTSAVDPIQDMDAIFSIETGKKHNETETEEQPVLEKGNQVLTFSILFIVLAIAMVPGMVGFAKAVQDGETGSKSDADFSIVMRDTIMTILGAALSAVQMFRSPRKNSAYKMAWVFSGLAVSLGITAIVVYPLANKAYSSLCGFFAQFFSIASLAILVLDGPEPTENGGPFRIKRGDADRTSQEKKNR